MVVVADVVVVVALAVADEDHSGHGHGHVYGHGLLRLSQDYEPRPCYSLSSTEIDMETSVVQLRLGSWPPRLTTTTILR